MPDRFPHDEFAPLERLFEAQSIAVIGASFNLDKIGGKPIRYLQTAGYQGAIHPVNPRYEAIANLPCYPNIAAIDSPIDVAIIVVPSHAVDTAIDDCVAAEVPFALIFSAGFGELGEEGRRRQADLVAK
uniref:CoA-binding protein n=1 Tax=Ilumatobacter sp. TaxID=1967498 RepID=UPI00375004FF